jgi:ABC-type thiamine transport system ATPase subunit
MDNREERILEAHEKTFRWIFKDSPFKHWLESKTGSNLFWISGKAGSGKSTLMKLQAGSGQGDFFGFFSLPGIIVDEARA